MSCHDRRPSRASTLLLGCKHDIRALLGVNKSVWYMSLKQIEWNTIDGLTNRPLPAHRSICLNDAPRN